MRSSISSTWRGDSVSGSGAGSGASASSTLRVLDVATFWRWDSVCCPGASSGVIDKRRAELTSSFISSTRRQGSLSSGASFGVRPGSCAGCSADGAWTAGRTAGCRAGCTRCDGWNPGVVFPGTGKSSLLAFGTALSCAASFCAAVCTTAGGVTTGCADRSTGWPGCIGVATLSGLRQALQGDWSVTSCSIHQARTTSGHSLTCMHAAIHWRFMYAGLRSHSPADAHSTHSLLLFTGAVAQEAPQVKFMNPGFRMHSPTAAQARQLGSWSSCLRTCCAAICKSGCADNCTPSCAPAGCCAAGCAAG